MVFLVSKISPASAFMLQASRGQIPSNHCITTKRGRRLKKQNTQFSNVNAPLQWLHVRCGEGDAIGCVLALLWLDEVSGWDSINNGWCACVTTSLSTFTTTQLFNMMNCVNPVHESGKFRSTFMQHVHVVCVVLVTSTYPSGIGNDFSFGTKRWTQGSTWWR